LSAMAKSSVSDMFEPMTYARVDGPTTQPTTRSFVTGSGDRYVAWPWTDQVDDAEPRVSSDWPGQRDPGDRSRRSSD
jgi:hypothetical protein